jgi:hypothetical protein
MLRLRQVIGACILASALVPIVEVHAGTYYVATNGSNSNPGTSSQPWRTVAYAASKMVAGDTTYVRGGTYNEGVIQFGKSGTSSAPIKLLNVSGEFPIINFIDKTKYHRILIKNYASYTKAIGWITIEGFELRNGSEGMKMYNGHDLTIRRNWIHHNDMGILGYGTRVLIDRNKINHNGHFTTCSTCTTDHGIYTNGSAFTITNNVIYDNLGYGIQVNGSSSSSYNSNKHAAPEFAGAKNWIISNNTFAYQKNRSGIILWGSLCTNTRIENNIFYENGVNSPSYYVQGIALSQAGSGHTIRNNLAYASGAGATVFLGSGSYTQSGNIVNTLQPKFANAPATLPSSPNFSLASGSPAIDKGLTISTTKISYPGISRPKLSTYDIGAYEYAGSSTTLAAPTSLQIAN